MPRLSLKYKQFKVRPTLLRAKFETSYFILFILTGHRCVYSTKHKLLKRKLCVFPIYGKLRKFVTNSFKLGLFETLETCSTICFHVVGYPDISKNLGNFLSSKLWSLEKFHVIACNIHCWDQSCFWILSNIWTLNFSIFFYVLKLYIYIYIYIYI